MIALNAYFRLDRVCLIAVLVVAVGSSGQVAAGSLVSYANDVTEVTGMSVDSARVVLGPPDDVYTDGAFSVGATSTFTFPAPLDDVPGSDLILYIFVTSHGTTSSTVKIEVRAAATDPFVDIATIVTSDATSTDDYHTSIADGGFGPYDDFDHVHPFVVDFDGQARKVTQVRISNLGGDDIKLDALEGIHPALSSPRYAVEMRIFRKRDDFSKRFALRFKNIAGLDDGVAMSGFTIEHATDAWIDQTDKAITSDDGEFAATPETTAGPDNGLTTQSTEYVWSGTGQGLAPGSVASHWAADTIDTDVPGEEFLDNMTFTITFADGTSLPATWDQITAQGASGQLFSLYEFPPHPVSVSEPRPAFFIDLAQGELIPEAICTDCAVGPPPNGVQPQPRACGIGMLGFTVFSLAALVSLRFGCSRLTARPFGAVPPRRGNSHCPRTGTISSRMPTE